MKSILDLLENRLTSKNALPSDRNLQVSYFSKLLELLQELANTVTKSTKEEIVPFNKKFEQIFNLIFNFSIPETINADPFAKIMGLILLSVIKKDNGMTMILFPTITNALSSSKTKTNMKLTLFSLLNFVLRHREEIDSLSSMLLQEILNVVSKILKSVGSSTIYDQGFKLNGLNIIRFLLEEKMTSNVSNRQEIYKLLLKFINEKSEDIRVQNINVLNIFIENTEIAFINSNFEQLQIICLKIFDEVTKPQLQKKVVYLYATILDIHYQVEKEIGLKDKSALKIKKRSSSVADQMDMKGKDKISEMILYCFTLLLKTPNIKYLIFEVLYLFLLKNKDLLNEKNLEDLIDFCFNCIERLPPTSDSDPYKIRDALTIFLTDLCRFLSKSQTIFFFQIISTKLVKMNPTQTTGPNLASDHLILLLLRTFLCVVHLLGTSIFDLIKKTNELSEIVDGYLFSENLLIKITGCQIFKIFAEKNPKWKSNILSLMLNLVTVQFAEIEGMNGESFEEKCLGLEGYCICLSLLLRNIDFNLQSIPFDIGNSIFETAKNLITAPPPQGSSFSPSLLSSISTSKKCAGWILLEQLLSFDIHWVGSKLKIIFSLWQSLFSIETPENLDTCKNKENLENELKVRTAALKTIRIFLRKCKSLQTDHVLKLIGSYLTNFYGSFFGEEEKDKKKIEKQNINNEIVMAKIVFFKCLCSLSPRFYQQKLNILVQNALDDIFIGNFCNMIGIIKDFIDDEDFQIAKHFEDQVYVKSILYKHDQLKSEGLSMEQNEQIILDYDHKYLHFKEKNHALKQNLCRILIEFLGLIYCSASFTIKNKNNLLKYFKTNLKTILGAKESPTKDLKIIPFLLIGVSIVLKMKRLPENEGIYDVELAGHLKEISMLCWSSNNSYIIIINSVLYANLFALNLIEINESLMKNLYENITSPTPSLTVSTIIGYICKYNDFSLIEPLNLELSNIFLKSSRIQEAKPWLLLSLKLCLENHKENALNVFKACFSFVFLDYLLENELNTLKYYLYSSMIEQFMHILLNMEASKIKNNLTLQIQELCLDLYGKFIPKENRLNKLAKLKLINSYFILSSIQKETTFKTTTLKYIMRTILKNDVNQKNEILKNCEILTMNINFGDFPKMHSLDPDFDRNLLQKFNALNSYIEPSKKVEESIMNLYHKVLFEELRLKVSTFEENFNFFKEILFSDNFLFRETLAARHSNEKVMNDNKEIEKNKINQLRKNWKLLIRKESPMEIEISPSTRVFILKCAEQLLLIINLGLMKKQEIVNFSSLIITFLFKIVTSNYEELREIALKLFIITFTKLKRYDENGNLIKNTKITEIDSLILQQYTVQIDAIISVNIKNELSNSPEINILTLKLFLKFFKLFIQTDFQSIKKLFNLLTKSIQTNLRIQPSPYFNEKSISSVYIKKLECICKLYFCLQAQPNLENELKELFSPLVKSFLFQNMIATIHDDAIILTNIRSVIKNYNRFFFVYNGAKPSYDTKLHFDTQYIFMKLFLIFLSEKDENCSNSFIFYDQCEKDVELNKNILLLLKNNQKMIGKMEDINTICLNLVIYNLCYNEAFEHAAIQNIKKEKKITKVQIISYFKHKIQMLEILKELMKYKIDETALSNILEIFARFFEYGLEPIDFLLVQNFRNLLENFASFDSNNIDKALILVQSIILRYKDAEKKENDILSNSVDVLKLFLLKTIDWMESNITFEGKNLNDLMQDKKIICFNSFFQLSLELIQDEKNMHHRLNFHLNMEEFILKLFNSFSIKNTDCLEFIFCVYFSEVTMKLKIADSSTKDSFTSILLFIHGIYTRIFSDVSNSYLESLYQNFVEEQELLKNSDNFKHLLNFNRSIYQDTKKINPYTASSIISLSFTHLTTLRSLPPPYPLPLLSELLKYFLSIFLFSPDLSQILFRKMILFIFLFIHKDMPPLLLTLTDQILRHVINSMKDEKKLEEEILKLPIEVGEVVKFIGNELKNHEKQGEFGEDKEEEKGGKPEGTIKLKMFGTKK